MIAVDPRRAGGVSPLFEQVNRGLTPPARLFALLVLAALLVLPIFAHGCHGDGDIDNEPQTLPSGSEAHP